MKLAAFFDAIAPLLEGRAGLAETARALYGGGGGVDGERLAIYARFCRAHRFEVLDPVYPQTRAEVLRRGGEELWADLVESYFQAHPMHDVELTANGALFPAFLDEAAASRGLPPWLPALADLERWAWWTGVAPDDPADLAADDGPLRLAATAELRPYRYDLLGWLDEASDEERAPAPPEGETLVLFWRHRDGDARRETAEPIELVVMQRVGAGEPAERVIAPIPGATTEELAETLDDLHAAGIVLGSRS